MVIKICPRCNERYSVSPDNIDYEHQCNSGNLALDQEDIVIVGNWEDYDGSGTKAPQEVLMQGAENKLWGTDAAIEGDNIENFTKRGLRASTRRQRQHFEYIKLGGCN